MIAFLSYFCLSHRYLYIIYNLHILQIVFVSVILPIYIRVTLSFVHSLLCVLHEEECVLIFFRHMLESLSDSVA